MEVGSNPDLIAITLLTNGEHFFLSWDLTKNREVASLEISSQAQTLFDSDGEIYVIDGDKLHKTKEKVCLLCFYVAQNQQDQSQSGPKAPRHWLARHELDEFDHYPARKKLYRTRVCPALTQQLVNSRWWRSARPQHFLWNDDSLLPDAMKHRGTAHLKRVARGFVDLDTVFVHQVFVLEGIPVNPRQSEIQG